MLDKIYNFFLGYVTVKIITNQPERFLNILLIKQIYLWDLKKISENELIFNISARGFKKLKNPVYEVNGKVKIINKKGLFTLKKKFRNKKILLPGIFLVIFFFMLLSSLILDIEIIGNNLAKTEDILEKLSEIDLQKFKFRSNIDNEKISVKLINDFDNIAWVGVYEKGTKLVIEIKERNMPPEMIPKDIPCHLVATKDGIIKNLKVTNGEKLVNLNQVVTKGQVLVSGIINTAFDGLRYVHSTGEIIAETWWEEELKIKLYEYKKDYTGKSTERLFLKIFNKEADLSFGKVIPYYNFDESLKRYVFGFLELNMKKYDEYTLTKKPVTSEEAIKRGKEALTFNLYENYHKNSVKEINFSVTDIDSETKSLKIFAKINENIAKQMIIRKENPDG